MKKQTKKKNEKASKKHLRLSSGFKKTLSIFFVQNLNKSS